MPKAIKSGKKGIGKLGGRWGLHPLWLLFALLFCLLAVTTANTSDTYHNLTRNTQPCSDCHTLHFSEGGTTPTKSPLGQSGFVQTQDPVGPFAMLLMRATTNGLCMFCHDGSLPQAPDVQADSNNEVTMYNGTGDEHSGAGFFANSGGTTSDKGHDLAVSANTVPFSSKTNVTLTCASCHDPHGTPNYRNILTAPAGGAGVSVIMEKDVYRLNSPAAPPTADASKSAYKKSNLAYKLNSSKWCAECHDQLKDHIGSSATPQQKKHHLADFSINASTNADFSNWEAGTNTGFGTATGDSNVGIPRLRFQAYSTTSVTSWDSANNVATNNEVMCMTCHLAHGGKYQKGLVWPKKEGGTDSNSGCNQCHNGAQQ